MSSILRCEQINAGYGASQVLFNVDFSVQEGEIVTLLGRNGMGKSTTVKSLVGTIPLMSGQIYFEEQAIASLAPDARARRGIALVPEGRMCFPNLTVHEHLVAFAANRNSSKEPWSVERLYGLFPKLKSVARIWAINSLAANSRCWRLREPCRPIRNY